MRRLKESQVIIGTLGHRHGMRPNQGFSEILPSEKKREHVLKAAWLVVVLTTSILPRGNLADNSRLETAPRPLEGLSLRHP